MQSRRYLHTATLLSNGKVLLVGGRISEGWSDYALATSEIFDPVAVTFSDSGTLNHDRFAHTSTRLQNGKILVAGGYRLNSSGTERGELASAEVFDPASGAWNLASDMIEARYGASASLLPNGDVLITGGGFGETYRSSAEVFNPTSGWQSVGPMSSPRGFHTSTGLPDGRVLIAAGRTVSDAPSPAAEIYSAAYYNNLPTAVNYRLLGKVVDSFGYGCGSHPDLSMAEERCGNRRGQRFDLSVGRSRYFRCR